MAFVWKADQRLKSPEQVARELLEVAKARGLDEFAAVLAVMCVAQESDFWCPANEKDPSSKNYPHDALSNDGRSVSYFQQQNGRAGDTLPPGDRDDWWGPMASRMDLKRSADVFYDRLEDNYRDAINNPLRAAQFIQNVQQSYWNGKPDHPGYYGKHWDRAWQLVRSSTTPTEENPMAVSGDPVWLEDVLREALGDRLVVHEGWKERGAGGLMGTIWGTMIHHTGNVNETVAVIRDGVQQPSGWLPGPLSQCLITPDGTCHLIAVGPCNHAGSGNWGTLTNGNRDSIGFECAYSGSGPWSQKQIITMRDATAAISKKIGKKAADSVCGHKEYAKPQGRKVDPGNMDMNWFRAEVQKDLDGFVFPGEHPPITEPPAPEPPKVKRFPEDWTDRELMLEILRQLRGPSLKGWEQLGGKSVVDAIAELGKS